MRLLLTAFGPFGNFGHNPSQLLLEYCGLEHTVLPVSYEAVQDYLSLITAGEFDALLMLGVHGSAELMHWESLAHNYAGTTPDVEGRIWDAKIVEDGPETLPSTLNLFGFEDDHLRVSDHAGSYLCNFALYTGLIGLTHKQVGFLHIPSFDKVSQEKQGQVVKRLVQYFESVDA